MNAHDANAKLCARRITEQADEIGNVLKMLDEQSCLGEMSPDITREWIEISDRLPKIKEAAERIFTRYEEAEEEEIKEGRS